MCDAILQDFVNAVSNASVICSYDADKPIILAANSAHESLTGYSSNELLGQSPSLFKGPKTSGMTSRDIKESVKHNGNWFGCVLNYTKYHVPYNVQILIIPIYLQGKPYYCAFKQKVKRPNPLNSVQAFLRNIIT